MTDCCSHTSSKQKQACPQCATSCKAVKMRTLYHQLKFPENAAIIPNDYFFCPLTQCSIAYFSTTGITIPTVHLRTYQEIQNNKLCYCFDIDADIYRSAIGTQRANSIKDFVIQHTKSEACACEIRNPSGLCCLAKFKLFEKEQKLNLAE